MWTYGFITSPRDRCGTCHGEEESPKKEERVTELEQTAARSTSIVRGNIFPFPSVYRAFSDPGETEPLTQGAHGSASSTWEERWPQSQSCSAAGDSHLFMALTEIGPLLFPLLYSTIVFKLQIRFYLIFITHKLN